MSDFFSASPSRRCPLCNGSSSCSIRRDRTLVLCHRRHGEAVPGYTFVGISKGPDGWGMYVPDEFVRQRHGGQDDRRASTSNPCPVCGQSDPGCHWSDGLHLCQARYPGDKVPGWRCVGTSKFDHTGMWRRDDDTRRGKGQRAAADGSSSRRSEDEDEPPPPPPLDFPRLARERHERALAEGQLDRLADRLGVRADALAALGVGYSATRYDYRLIDNADTPTGKDWERITVKGGWCFPERDAGGKVVGLKFRLPLANGKDEQRYERTSGHGLIYADDWESRTDDIYLVEGGSDAAAMLTMGLCAIARPSNKGGIDYLAKLLAHVPATRNVVVVGENDGREMIGGQWKHPGKEGAISTAQQLAEALGRPVYRAMPPSHYKDSRDCLTSKNPDLGDLVALRVIGRRYAEDLGCGLTRYDPPEEEVAPARPSPAPPSPWPSPAPSPAPDAGHVADAAAPAQTPPDEEPDDDAPPTRRDLVVGAALQLGMRSQGVYSDGTVLFARPDSGRLVYVLPDDPRPGKRTDWWPFLAGAAKRRGFATRAEVNHAELAAWAAESGDEADVARLVAEGELIGVGEEADLAELLLLPTSSPPAEQGANLLEGDPSERQTTGEVSLYEREIQKTYLISGHSCRPSTGQVNTSAGGWADELPPKTMEEEARAAKRTTLWRRKPRPCLRPPAVIVQHKLDTHRGLLMDVRCRCWTCDGCATWARLIWQRHLWDRIQAAAKAAAPVHLYVWRGPESAYVAVQRRISYRGRADGEKAAKAARADALAAGKTAAEADSAAFAAGEAAKHPYCRIRTSPTDLLVVTTARISGATATTADDAADQVVDAIEATRGEFGRRPVTTSPAWELPRKVDREWTLLGQPDDQAKARAVLECQGVGVTLVSEDATKPNGMQRCYRLDFPPEWGDDEIANAMALVGAINDPPAPSDRAPYRAANPTAIVAGIQAGEVIGGGPEAHEGDWSAKPPATETPSAQSDTPEDRGPHQRQLPWVPGDTNEGEARRRQELDADLAALRRQLGSPKLAGITPVTTGDEGDEGTPAAPAA